MVSGLPAQNIFMLVCCYQPQCCHPVCKMGTPPSTPEWYSGGPPVIKLPLPVVDPERPWGGTCQSCDGICSGHYKIVLTDVTDQRALCSTAPPPSTILKEEFSKSPDCTTETFVKEAAKKALLTADDARIWIEHLQTVLKNRKRGAAKAAATRRAKKAASAAQPGPRTCTTPDNTNDHCGICGKEFISETHEPELWIGCDLCDRWFCGLCEHLTHAPVDHTYICSLCRNS